MRRNRNLRARHRRMTTRSPELANVQHLEKRALLAGNAVASLNGPHLTVIGDSANNTVEITVLGGNVVVRGLDNTTINGSAGEFIIASGTNTVGGNIHVTMGDGNDVVLFSRNVQVTGSTVARGGRGDDSIGSTGGTFGGGLWIHGNRGDDTISVQDSDVTGKLWIKTKQGADVVSVTDTSVSGRLKIKTGSGDDAVSVNGSSVTEKLSIHTGSGRDDIVLQNSTFSKKVKIRTRADADAILLEGNTFDGPVKINTGRNDDSVLVRAGNTFNRRFKVYSGDGNNDAVEIVTGSVFNSSISIRKTESRTVSPLIISSRFDDANTGVIAKAQAADDFFTELLVGSPQDLMLDTSSNSGVMSTGDVLITRDSDYNIGGTTTARSTIDLDVNGDGIFDDGTTTADDDGNFFIVATLERTDLFGSTSAGNDQLNGFQTITVRSTDEAGGVQTATTSADLVENTVVQYVSNVGVVEVELFDAVTPNTVANFLGYLTRYTNSFIHRSVPSFIIQGGGFTVDGGVIQEVPTDAAITNEFNTETSNIRGTLSMAQLGGDINSGTSQWFFNTVDNTSLDSVPHTVFGRVIGEGMTVVDQMAAIGTADLTAASGLSALTDVPQRQPFLPLSLPLAGTVSTTANDSTVTGTGTSFTGELTSILGNPNGSRSRISINGQTFDVSSIVSDTELVVSSAPTFSASDVQARTDEFIDDDFVRFSAIQEILQTP
jgi:cyclophilin family peptidyl-prolyl cis-trans isomerase